MPKSNDTLQRAAALYGVEAASLRELGAFASDVYAFDGPQGPGILKVMAPGHRSPQQVQAEVDWLLALTGSGVSVAPPLRNRAGGWVEELEPYGAVVVAYHRVAGEATRASDWTDELIASWGELLGRLQSHARRWSPPGPLRHRLLEASHVGALDAFADSDPEFHAAASELLGRATPLLDGSGDSGLVHADLHHGNLLLHEGRWTAIDFDDCGYASYAFDLAMPIFYALRADKERSSRLAAERFVPPFLRGFRRWAPDPECTAEELCDLLRFREVELVVALGHGFARDKLTPALRRLAQDLREHVVASRNVLEPAHLASLLG